ncbi:MAG: acetyltransferase [Rubrivivax sp.]|nr:MAG: acetyltransferase [Rubrivivax sp.]
MSKTSLIIVGAGALSREVICWVESAQTQGLNVNIKGYLVDPEFNKLPEHYQLPWLGKAGDYAPQPDEACLIAISDPATKHAVAEQLQARGARFFTFIHPSAVVARTARLGQGCILCPHAMVSADADVGDFVTINAHTSLGHDSKVGHYVNFSAHVDITGYVEIGEGSFFGSGARVLPKLKIGANAKIGAGAVVMRSIPSNSTVYTTPAKRLR